MALRTISNASITETVAKPITLSLSAKKTDTEVKYSEFTTSLINESKGIIINPFFASASKFQLPSNQRAMPHTVSGQNLDFRLYGQIYNNVGIVKNAVNNTANFAVQSGYELDGEDAAVEKAQTWIDKHNFNLWMLNIFKLALKHGNGYLEFASEDDFKLLPTEQMFVIASTGKEDNGKVVGYAQADTFNPGNAILFKPENIIHFKWNEDGNSFYGVPDIRSAIPSIKTLLQYMEDIGTIIHRYGHPILHWTIGTEEIPGNQTQVDNLVRQLNSLRVGEDLVTTFGVTGNVLSSDMKLIQLDGLLHMVENQVIGALEIPAFFIKGGESSNRSTSQSELQAFDRRVKALQSAMGQIIEDKIFKNKLGVDVKFAWKELSVEGEESKSNILKNLSSPTGAGIPTKTGMKMVGWGSWEDEFDEDKKEQDEQAQVQAEAEAKTQAKFAPKPMGQPKMKNPPREEDYVTQADWALAWDIYKKGSVS